MYATLLGEMSQHCWVFLTTSSGSLQLASLKSEEEACYLAEQYPEHIYFFAGAVLHPLS